MEAIGIAARVEGDEARVDAALAQRGQQLQQVLLGATDPLHFRRVNDLHRARISA